MNNVPLEILVPVFNEGKKILDLLQDFQKNIKTKFRVLFCYDLNNDNIFQFKNEISKFDFEVLFIESIGPNTVILLGKWNLTREAGDLGGHFSLIWKKIKGKWVIVIDHTS